MGTLLKLGGIVGIVAVGRALNRTVGDLKGCMGVQNVYRESRLKHLVPLLPIHRRLEVHTLAVVVQHDILRERGIVEASFHPYHPTHGVCFDNFHAVRLVQTPALFDIVLFQIPRRLMDAFIQKDRQRIACACQHLTVMYLVVDGRQFAVLGQGNFQPAIF